jgi:hypothetical protein
MITEVTDMMTGALIPDWRTIWPEANSLPGTKYEGRFVWQKRLAGLRRAIKAR